MKYRQVGGRLGAYIRANSPSTQQIQYLLADLLAGDPLLQTMRDVVSMPAFATLQALSGSGSGAVHRDSLLQELAKRYLPAVVDDVGQLINGMLDQPAGQTIYGSNITSTFDGSPSISQQQGFNSRELKDLEVKHNEIISDLSQSTLFEQENPQSLASAETQTAEAARRDDAAYQYIKPRKSIDPRSQADPAYRYITEAGAKSERAEKNLLGSVAIFGVLAIGVLGLLSLVTSSDYSSSQLAGDSTEQRKDEVSRSDCDSVLRRIEDANVHDAVRIFEANRVMCTTADFKRSASGWLNSKTADYNNNGGDQSISLDYYLKALAVIAPESGDTVEYNIGATLIRLKRYKEAITYLDSFLRKNPRDAYGYNERGTAYGWLGDWGKACSDTKKARDLGLKTVLMDGKEAPISQWISEAC